MRGLGGGGRGRDRQWPNLWYIIHKLSQRYIRTNCLVLESTLKIYYMLTKLITKWLHLTSMQVHQIVDIQHLKIHSLLNSCIGTKNVQFIENDQIELRR